MRRAYRGLAGCVAVLVLIAPSCAFSETRTVSTTGSFTFKPVTTRIAKDDKIKWVNATSFGHTITSYGRGWNKDVVLEDEGDTTAKRFTRTGTFTYRCRFHSELVGNTCSGMCGKVVVR